MWRKEALFGVAHFPPWSSSALALRSSSLIASEMAYRPPQKIGVIGQDQVSALSSFIYKKRVLTSCRLDIQVV